MMNHPWDQTIVGFIHLTSACIAVGGLLFWRFALLGDATDRRNVILRFRPWFWAAAILLLLTGTYTSWIRHEQNYPVWYFHVLSLKMVLYIVLFGVAGALTKPRTNPSRMQQNSAPWLGVCVVLGLLILLTSAFMRRVKPEVPVVLPVPPVAENMLP